MLSLGGGRPVNFWCLKAGGFLKQELSTERWILRWIFLVAKYKGKIRQKNRPENPPAEIEKSAGGEPPPETPSQSPPPPPKPPPPPLGRPTPSPEPSGLDSLRLSVSVAGLCEAPLLVEVHILLSNQSLEGCFRSSGQVLNEERMQLSQGLAMASQRCALSIFGVKVWALNIEKNSAVRLCKTWQAKRIIFVGQLQ